MTRDIPCDLKEIIMMKVSDHIQSRICSICDNITLFGGMFISPLVPLAIKREICMKIVP